MGTVIPFRDRKDETPRRGSKGDSETPPLPAHGAVKSAGRGFVAAVVFVVFIVLFSVRRPVRFILRMISGASMLGLLLIVCGLNGTGKAMMLWATGGMFLAAAGLAWGYDSLLLRLAPEPIVLT